MITLLIVFMFMPKFLVFILESAGLFRTTDSAEGGSIGLSTAAVTAVVNLLVLEFIIRFKNHQRIGNQALGLIKPDSLRWYLSAVTSYFILMFLLAAAMTVLQIIPSEDLKDASRDLLKTGTSFFSFAVTFASIILIASVTEELIFRGFLYGWLRQRFISEIATVISSLAFGIVHVQYLGLDSQSVFAAMFFICGLGFFAARLREKSGSIYPSIALHSFSNFMVFISLY